MKVSRLRYHFVASFLIWSLSFNVFADGDAPNKLTRSEVLEGKVITFNTRDQEGCDFARLAMHLGEEVCKYNPLKPLVSVVVVRQVEDREYFEKKIDFSKLSEKEQIALKSLMDFGIMGVGAFGLIYAMPESMSGWDKSRGFAFLASRYKDRVSTPPAIDNDDWAINYLGHPYSGAVYYTMVRHQGFSAMQAAAFSFCMSTFFWEYGIEAFAEVPSIQDLIITPLLGSVLGEVFYLWGNAIKKHDGKLFGSKILGKTVSVLMDPAGEVEHQVNKLAKYKLIKDAEFSITDRGPVWREPGMPIDANEKRASYIGLQFKFKF